MGCCQVTSFHYVSLLMPLSLWEHFEMSCRDTKCYVAAASNQQSAFIENEHRHCVLVIGTMHLYVDAVYTMYRITYQLELLGVIRPMVRHNCDILVFQRDVCLGDQSQRV